MTSKGYSVALAGNPNAGKTTLFNALTGAHRLVANYPGVTVERTDGSYIFDGMQVKVTDLPGTHIDVERRAPSGDPIWIRMKGFQLSLRREEASGVLVA